MGLPNLQIIPQYKDETNIASLPYEDVTADYVNEYIMKYATGWMLNYATLQYNWEELAMATEEEQEIGMDNERIVNGTVIVLSL